jgi:hypothetical protein
MMEAVREKWTDERLDDLAQRVDRGFEAADRRFDAIDRRFDALQRSILQAAIAMTAAYMTGFAALAGLIVAFH